MEKFKVERFATKTGVRLKADGQIYREEDANPGIMFVNEEEAKKYARANIRAGEEFIVFDSEGKIIYEHVYDVVYGKKEKKWWEFWK